MRNWYISVSRRKSSGVLISCISKMFLRFWKKPNKMVSILPLAGTSFPSTLSEERSFKRSNFLALVSSKNRD